MDLSKIRNKPDQRTPYISNQAMFGYRRQRCLNQTVKIHQSECYGLGEGECSRPGLENIATRAVLCFEQGGFRQPRIETLVLATNALAFSN